MNIYFLHIKTSIYIWHIKILLKYCYFTQARLWYINIYIYICIYLYVWEPEPSKQFCVAYQGHLSIYCMNRGKEGAVRGGEWRIFYDLICNAQMQRTLPPFLTSSLTIRKWCCYTNILHILFYKFVFPLWWFMEKKELNLNKF